MKPQNKTVTAASVTPSVAELQKLTPAEVAVDFVKQTVSAIRAFIVAAKLLIVLEPMLKPGQTLGSVILKLANVPNDLRRRVKSTIDNGRQAVRVWKELVEPGHVTEAEFDGFTFGDFVALNRVMSGASRQKLTGADVALILESSPSNWHEELACLFTYGQTLADRADAEKKAATKKTAQTTTATEETESASPDAETSDESAVAPAKADAETGEEVEPGKIVQMPVKPTSEDAFKLIAGLEALLANMDATEVAKVAPAIAELNETIQASLVAAKPAKKARKTKAA
jgi:hypothetical protein